MKNLIESILTITDDPRRDYSSDKIVEQKLFELLSEQLQQPVVMQAEVSDVSAGAAVGNSAAVQSGSDGIMKWCDSCGKITKWIDGDCENYKKRGGSDKGALPR